MKAIQTRVLHATNTKPSRIKALAEGVPSRIYSRDYLENLAGLDNLNTHERAAHCFALSRNWSPTLVSGGLPNGDWCHCFVDRLQGVVAQAREFVEASYPTQPGLIDGTKKCSAYHFELLKTALGYPPVTVPAKPPVRDFTVITVSSNANSFGYKGVLVLAEDGTGYECAFQAYGSEPLPKPGDVIPEDRLPKSPVWRSLPKVTTERALKIIASAKGGDK
jgi:hypothetical protein